MWGHVCALTQPDFQLIAMLACKHETCPALVALWLGNCNARVPVWTRRWLKPSAFPRVDRLLISVSTSAASHPVLVAWLLMLLTCHCFLALRRQHLETPCGHAWWLSAIMPCPEINHEIDDESGQWDNRKQPWQRHASWLANRVW